MQRNISLTIKKICDTVTHIVGVRFIQCSGKCSFTISRDFQGEILSLGSGFIHMAYRIYKNILIEISESDHI